MQMRPGQCGSPISYTILSAETRQRNAFAALLSGAPMFKVCTVPSVVQLKDSILAFFENDEQQAWSGSTSASEASTIQTGCATPEMQCE